MKSRPRPWEPKQNISGHFQQAAAVAATGSSFGLDIVQRPRRAIAAGYNALQGAGTQNAAIAGIIDSRFVTAIIRQRVAGPEPMARPRLQLA